MGYRKENEVAKVNENEGEIMVANIKSGMEA